MPVNHVEIYFSAELPNPDLISLTASATPGLAALQCYEDDDDYLHVKLEPQDLPQSINAVAQENPLDFFELQQNDAPLDLLREQMKDANIREVITWISQRKNTDSLYSNWELKKNHKQLPRLELVKGVLHRKFFGNTVKTSYTGKTSCDNMSSQNIYAKNFYMVSMIVNSVGILE